MRLFKNVLTIFALLVGIHLVGNPAFAQPLAVEDFDNAPGTNLTAIGWTAHSGAGNNPISIVSPGLSYDGYLSSSIGNAVGMTTTGEDAFKAFAAQSSGSVYAAMMVRLSEASTAAGGGYFFHLGNEAMAGTSFRARIYARKAATGEVNFGISKSATAAEEIVWSGNTYSLNTTYLLVVKYTIIDGEENDTVVLYVNPTIEAEPGSPTLSAGDNASFSDIAPAGYALRQGSANTHPTVTVDGIRIGKSWASVMGGTEPPIERSKAPVDIDGDGTTDYVVVRADGGFGSQLRWHTAFNGGSPGPEREWGISGDDILTGDYDGDGKDDVTVFRHSNGTFYIIQSETLTLRIDQFGQSGDDPRVVGDYDGDGIDDIAVYRGGSQGYWFYKTSPTADFHTVEWGGSGDVSAPGDYDGDGKADFVVYRSQGGNGSFWQMLSGGTIGTEIFGQSGDIVAPGDYDGDGKTDPCVIREEDGFWVWEFRPSGTEGDTVVTDVWGEVTDVIAQGDYDGDGKTDYAIFRPGFPSSFYVMTVGTRNIFTKEWGAFTDIPVASFDTH